MAIPNHVLSTGVNVWRNNKLPFTGMNPSLAAPTLEWSVESRAWNDDSVTNLANYGGTGGANAGLVLNDKVYWFDQTGQKRGWLRCLDLETGAEDWATDLRYKIDNYDEALPSRQTSGPPPPGSQAPGVFYPYDSQVVVDCVTDDLVIVRSFGSLTDFSGWGTQHGNPPQVDIWRAYHGRVWAFSTSSGALAWMSEDLVYSFPVNYSNARWEQSNLYQTPIVVPGGDFIFCLHGGIIRLDASDGTTVWKKNAVPFPTDGNYLNNEPGYHSGGSEHVGPTLMASETEFMLIGNGWGKVYAMWDGGHYARLYSVANGTLVSQMDNPPHKYGAVGSLWNHDVFAAPPMTHSTGGVVIPASSYGSREFLYPGVRTDFDPVHTAFHTAPADLSLSWKSRLMMDAGPWGWAEGAGGHIYGLAAPVSQAAPGNYGEPIALDIADGTEQHRASATMWVDDPTGVADPPPVYHMRSFIHTDGVGSVFVLAVPAISNTALFDGYVYQSSTIEGNQTFVWAGVVPKLKVYSSNLNLGWEMGLRPYAYDVPWSAHSGPSYDTRFGIWSTPCWLWPPIFASHSVSSAKYMLWNDGRYVRCYKQGGTGPAAPPKPELQYVDGAGWIPVP